MSLTNKKPQKVPPSESLAALALASTAQARVSWKPRALPANCTIIITIFIILVYYRLFARIVKSEPVFIPAEFLAEYLGNKDTGLDACIRNSFCYMGLWSAVGDPCGTSLADANSGILAEYFWKTAEFRGNSADLPSRGAHGIMALNL
jgi:hypothetical protein